MYAIIQDGDHQWKVEEGQTLDIDYRDASVGDEITFDRVLAVRDDAGLRVGKPSLEGATVTAKVTAVLHGPKLTVQKMRRRKNYRRKTGHRQIFTQVVIQAIQSG